MLKKTFISFTLILCLMVGVCSAAPSQDNAMIAVALYIDTSGHYVPGMDLLNKALNEIIRFKINALFLGSEVLSGNEVLRGLNRCGITDTASATENSLFNYTSNAHVNYVMLFTVHPLDLSMDLKAFSAASQNYLVDKTVTRPDSSEALSTLETFSSMLSNEISGIFQSIHS